MGINGFNTFITEYGLRKPYKLSNIYVVIDGTNLCYGLYEDFSKDNPNDYLFGGNYTEYRKLFENFFENLSKCNITAIVVFDGETNPDLSESRMKRFKQKLDKSRELSDNPPFLPLRSDQSTRAVNPRLMKKSFKSVAKEMKFKCFTTKLDADLEMAKLAIHLKCPIITNDTDFFLMNIKGGVIGIDSLKWQNPLRLNQNYIECQVYRIDELLQFKNWYSFDFSQKQIELKAEMLPIFGSLMGNDAIDGQLFDDLFIEIAEQTNRWPLITDSLRYSRLFKHKRWRKMDQLLCWLAIRFGNANEAILHIESYCHRSRNPRALQQLRDSLKSYDTNGKSDLKELLDNKTNREESPIEANESQSFQMNSLMATLNETRVSIKRPLIENFSLESTYESSIRLKGFHLGLLRNSRRDETPLLFITRKGDSFEKILIPPETHIRGTPDGDKVLPVLSEIKNLSETERKSLLFDILKFKEQWITDLERRLTLIKVETKDIQFWKYFLIVITYWKSNSKLKRLSKFQFISAFVEKLIYFRHNSLISDDFNGMTSVEFCSGQQFHLFVIHYYCEFQSIYSSIDKLVSILDDPIVGDSLHHYFNGILLYNLFHKMIVMQNNIRPFKEDRLNTIYNIIINSILQTNN